MMPMNLLLGGSKLWGVCWRLPPLFQVSFSLRLRLVAGCFDWAIKRYHFPVSSLLRPCTWPKLLDVSSSPSRSLGPVGPPGLVAYGPSNQPFQTLKYNNLNELKLVGKP